MIINTYFIPYFYFIGRDRSEKHVDFKIPGGRTGQSGEGAQEGPIEGMQC